MQLNSRHTPILPVLSLLLAATLWGVYWYPLRWLVGHGLDGAWIVLLVYLATLIYVPGLVRHRWHEFGRERYLLVGIALTSGACNTLFILGVLEGDVVRVTLLFFLSPVWATLLARLFLQERIALVGYGTVMLALCGAMLILWQPSVGFPWPRTRADVFGLISGMAFAFSNIFINKAVQVSTPVKTTAAWCGAVVIAGSIILFGSHPVVLPDANAVQAALLVGVIGMGVMTLAVTYGVSHLPVHRSAVIMLFEVVVASVSSLLLTNERPHGIEWLGGAMVMVAAYLAIKYQPQPSDA